jgi:iron-sulfur cluster assembly protein
MINLTDAAISKIQSQLINKNFLGIRIKVRPYGCTGMAYILEFADKINIDDSVIDINDVKIIIDDNSSVFLNNTIVDYEVNGLNEGFSFKNPDEKARCGCGKSFSV